MKTIVSKLLLLSFFVVVLSSCMTTRTSVGTYKSEQGTEQVYASGRQMWLLWGLFPIGITSVETPADGNCEVVTKFDFTDVLISCITGGVFATYTIEVKVKKQ